MAKKIEITPPDTNPPNLEDLLIAPPEREPDLPPPPESAVASAPVFVAAPAPTPQPSKPKDMSTSEALAALRASGYPELSDHPAPVPKKAPAPVQGSKNPNPEPRMVEKDGVKMVAFTNYKGEDLVVPMSLADPIADWLESHGKALGTFLFDRKRKVIHVQTKLSDRSIMFPLDPTAPGAPVATSSARK